MKELSGGDLNGRELRLDMATPRGNSGGDGGFGTPRGGQRGGRGGELMIVITNSTVSY